MEKRNVNPWTWQDAMGYSQAIELGQAKRTLVCAGQTSVDDQGSPLHAGDMAAQLKQAMANLETVLQAGGFDLTDVVRLNFYTTDIGKFMQGAAGGGLVRLAETNVRPASTLLGVAALFHPDIMVEIEATAMK
jgi:enamine deaminase RidA (YjgF/YER057c/UK114 family)